MLGTGDAQAEGEWEDMIRELEESELLATARVKDGAKRAQSTEASKKNQEHKQKTTSWFGGRSSEPRTPKPAEDESSQQKQIHDRPKFMM